MTTRGRYYFSPPGTPFVPGVTHLGSRRWHDANWTHVVNLGEQLDAHQTFQTGRAPPLLPGNRIVGSLQCIADGESPEDFIDPDELIDGFPPQCFAGADAADLLWQRASALGRCSVQRFYARMIDFLYVDNGTEIVNGFHELLNELVQVTVHAGNDTMPAVATVVTPTFSIAVVDGTRNFQQIALQALTSIRRPTNRGELSTIPLWWDASQWVHDHLVADGADATKPVLLAGHSYGGAACLILAARYRHANEDRVVKAITFGTPKPGDIRLIALLHRCETWNFANDSDLATVFPPDAETLLPVMIALGAPQLAVWTEWERPPHVRVMDAMGHLSPGPPPLLDFSTLLAIAEDVLAFETISPIQGHSITTYINRIETRCGQPEWPVTEEMTEDWPEPPPEPAHADYVILMEDSGNVLQEHNPPILVEDN